MKRKSSIYDSPLLIFSFLITISMILNACGPTKNEEPPQTLIQPSLTQTNTPLPTETIIPTITSSKTSTFTPTIAITSVPPGVEINYSIVVVNYQTLNITTTISNILSPKTTLYRLATPTLDSLPPIAKINIVDENGKAITYNLSTWQGDADRHLQILDIQNGDSNKAIISYILNLQSQKYWQVTPKYIAAAEYQIFFQPDPDTLTTSKIRFQFSMPDNWKVATRLTPYDGGYELNLKDTFRVITLNHEWQHFFLGGPLALGEFEIIENKFDDIRVLAAYPIGNAEYAKDASYVAKIFAYQESILGNPSLGMGDYGILYVFGPKIPNRNDGGLISTIESKGTFETNHVTEDRHVAHEMFHMWYGDGHFEPDAWRFIRVPAWFVEGANEYLGVKASLITGAFSIQMSNQWHNQFYSQYKSITGTSNDVPVTKCLDSLSYRSSTWVICLYSKTHTVFFLFDQLLNQLTANKVGLEGYIKYLIEKYSSDPTQMISEDDMQTAASEISGYDFKPFFDAYITGNEKLPVDINNGELTVLWDKLPILQKK